LATHFVNRLVDELNGVKSSKVIAAQG